MPAARAAKIICCLGMRSVSSVGSIPVSSAKSSPPMSMATVRPTAPAISGMRKKAAGVSTMAMKRVWPAARPRFASSFATVASKRRRCAASSTFVTAMPFTSGPTRASRSRAAIASGRLMRTTTSAPPRRTREAARATSLRALSFSAAGTLSSRSSSMQSAPRACAFSTYFSTFTGT